MFRLAYLGAIVEAAKPVVELSLAGNLHGPVSGAIASAEQADSSGLAADIGALDSIYAEVFSKASARLGATISKALGGRASFANIVEPTIKVSVVSGNSDDSAGVGAVRNLESKRNAAQHALVSAARAELEELANVVIAEFDKQLRNRRSSFLGYSRGVNVRLVPNTGAPSISNLIANMQGREDAAEGALRSKILALEMSLVQNLNRVGAAALGH